jgi:F-type H+-transporting ATPase subunit b
MAYRKTATRLGLSLAGMFMAVPVLAASEESSGGLPQLDFATWPTQVFWLIISFTVAYVLMWRVVTPSIASVLEDRHTRISDDMERAKQAASEAEQMRLSFEQRLSAARNEAADKTRETIAAVQADAEKKDAAANKRIATKISKAEDTIMEARSKALKELDDVAAEGAVDAAAALAGIKVTKIDAKKAVKEAAKAIPMAGEQN